MTELLKIAMVAACPFPYPRGTPIRIFRMCEALSRRGHEIHVVTYHLGDDSKGFPFQVHRIPDVKTYKKCSPGPSYQKLLVLDSLLITKVSKVLKKHEIDLLHAHHYEGFLVSLAARRWKRQPVLFDVHTLLESELPFYDMGLPFRIKKRIGRFLDLHLPGFASHIIAVTEDIKFKLVQARAAAEEDISVVTNGVEHAHFDAKPYKGWETKKKGRTLIFTGNLADYQGVDILLRCVKEVLRKRTDVRLVIVSNDDFKSYDALSTAMGIRENIDIVPADLDTLPLHLMNADVALNPRTNCDGIPQKLLNYMAAGKPIVSFLGSAKYLKHEELGWLVPDNDIAAFADGILFLLEDVDLAQRLGSNAKKFVRAEFSWEKTAEKIELVYEHALSTR